MNIRQRAAGFTLIELLVVMAIIATLLTLVAPRYFGSVDKARETVLQENLHATRDAIDKHYGDTGRYPESLEDLVRKKYLRKIPIDPITERSDTWVIVPPQDVSLGAIYDIHSGSEGISSRGVPFKSW